MAKHAKHKKHQQLYEKEQALAKQKTLLIPAEEYLKSGVHIGTKFKTKFMEDFIYKVRPDGLSVFNIEAIDQRLKLMINFLSQYEPEDIVICSRRENSWKPVRKCGELTGIRVFTGRYPAGMLTNPSLKTFTEAKVLLVTDPWPDRNAVRDASKVGIPVVALCDTNNQPNFIDLCIPCNNKGKKSLGLIFYLFTKHYMLNKGLISSESEFKYSVEDFTEE
ncbi:30S ribosomal protein S2 [Candidatus Woesearchaeota archaeon]|nr:30S ribosomal protein S2 [Candidatus Woesearchaeota archaeon]